MMSPVLEGVALAGDPAAIRDSARTWARTSAQCARWAEDVRGCRADGFEGDEAERFGARIEEHVHDLRAASEAWQAGSRALSGYADRLEGCQARLGSLLASAAGAIEGDGMRRPAVDKTALETRLLDSRVLPVLIEHEDAVRRCRSELDAARLLLPTIRAVDSVLLMQSGLAQGLRRFGPTTLRPTARWQTSASTWSTAGIRRTAASLRTAAGQSAMMGVALLPTPTDLDDFFSELDRLLGTAALALSVLGPGAGSGMALAGGAGTVAGAPEVLAVAGAAAAGVGLAVLVASIVQGESPGEEFDKIVHGNKIKGTPEVDLHDLAKLNREDIPPDVLKEADEAVARAKIGK
jgi:hypothetical protein